MENPFKKTVEENKTEEINNENITTDDTKTDEQTDETVENQTEQINPYEAKYNDLNNQYIRLAADFDNFRKRTEQEREALLKYGAESTLKKMLEVLDNFERGLKAIESVDNCDKVKECYNLAYKNFTDVLSKLGLEHIESEGQMFDPNFHEAVMQTPSSDKEENSIIAELQKGYKLGDKVLRPALVNVASAE